jgi:micrococcal nuclease
MEIHMADSRAGLRLVSSRGRKRRNSSGWTMAVAFLVVGAVGGTLLGRLPEDSVGRLLEPSSQTVTLPSAAPVAGIHRSFLICGSGRRVSCVVDGDTFWLDGVKIRIADINTPEVISPGCAAEAALGRQATTRPAELLNAGPFELSPADRDEDRYGRKLRIVERGGRSIGDALVNEGLAHRWEGYQQDWC